MHHWQCNWRVAWTSSRVCAGKRRTLRATIVTLLSHMTKCVSVFVKCDTIFLIFLVNYHKFELTFSRQCGRDVYAEVWWEVLYGFVGNLVLFQQWDNFENPLRIDKIITTSLVYYFLGHSVEDCARRIVLLKLLTNTKHRAFSLQQQGYLFIWNQNVSPGSVWRVSDCGSRISGNFLFSVP